jgi:hypothetical protein
MQTIIFDLLFLIEKWGEIKRKKWNFEKIFFWKTQKLMVLILEKVKSGVGV